MNLIDMRRHLERADLDLSETGLNGMTRAIRDLFEVVGALVAHVAAAEGVSIDELTPPPAPLEEDPFEGEDVTDFVTDGRLHAIGRGVVLTGNSPFEDGPVPVGRLIRVNGRVWRITGVERFAILRPLRKGDPVGFVVKPA